MEMMNMLSEWVRLMNQQFQPNRKCCIDYRDSFGGYFPEDFLARSYYVVVPQIPMPAYQWLEEHGLHSLFDHDLAGLTLDNTYYLLPSVADNLRVHFHELVHVAQWQHFGVEGFINRYLEELKTYGYEEMPLERMAYDLDRAYSQGEANVQVLPIVKALY